MTATADPGVDFWLEYVTAEGGLHERVGGSTLVVLPETLQERHRQDAEMTVTTDPDAAREERAMLMTVGHPLLTAAAETVLGDGDIGLVRLPRPAGRTAELAQLQEWARDRLQVDHGRVDLTGGPRPSVRYLVRVSALATFTMSADDQFHEQLECWIDVPSGLPLVGGAGELAGLIAIDHGERDQLTPDPPGLAQALVAADLEIGRRAESRRRALGDDVRPAFRAEADRARDYYEQMAQSLRKRMATAASDRIAGYQERLDHCHAERDRRLAEIEVKYQSSVACLPFRLHLVGVPSLTVEAGIRRGNRWYSLDLEWLSGIRRFAPVACPGCGSGEPLVAGKDGLGCRGCRPPRILEPVPQPAPARRSSPPNPPSRPQPAGPASTERSGAPRASAAGRTAGPGPSEAKPADRPRPRIEIDTSKGASPAAVTRTGDKLTVRLWERVEAGERSIGRMFTPDGPAAALARIYGPAGPRMALGLGDQVRLLNVTNSPSVPVPGTDYWLTIGALGASDRSDYPFQVLWHLTNGRPLVDEVLGVANGVWPALPRYRPRYGFGPGLWSVTPTPREAAATRDDPVAGRILETTVDCQGIAIAARCLAAWWRLDPDVAADLVEVAGPDVVAAGLDRQITRRAWATGRTDAGAAADYEVDPAAVKSMAARLQRRLSLGPTQPW